MNLIWVNMNCVINGAIWSVGYRVAMETSDGFEVTLFAGIPGRRLDRYHQMNNLNDPSKTRG